jgi:pimeloyl-ACP methyl ester carboxylesterase
MIEPQPSSPAPLVPALADIQRGYGLDCRELPVLGATVRLFTVPGTAQDSEHAIVCLPGMGASGRSFAPMAPLAEKRSLLFWTPPLHTPSTTTPLEHNLKLLWDGGGLLPNRFVLMGSSYGSLIALAFALRHPERVRALILVSPVASNRRIRRAGFAATTFLRTPLPFAYVFAPIVARILGGKYLPPVGRAEIVREARRIPPLELGRRLTDVLRSDFLPALDRLKMPVQLVHGGRDRIVPLSAAKDVASRLPRARFDIIPKAAHLPYMSHPVAFNQVVDEFLNDALGGASS